MNSTTPSAGTGTRQGFGFPGLSKASVMTGAIAFDGWVRPNQPPKASRTHVFSCIAALSLCLTVSAECASLLVNGDFADGLTGWTVVITSGTAGIDVGGAFFGFDNAGLWTLSQSFATTPGESYDFSFFARSSQPVNILRYQFDTGPIENVAHTLSMTKFIGDFTATGSTTKLQFYFGTQSGTGNLGIDDVVVTGGNVSAIPEPGSALALGLLIGSGLFLRSRRSS